MELDRGRGDRSDGQLSPEVVLRSGEGGGAAFSSRAEDWEAAILILIL